MAEVLQTLRDLLITLFIVVCLVIVWVLYSDEGLPVTVNETYYQIRVGKAANKWNDWRIKPGKPQATPTERQE